MRVWLFAVGRNLNRAYRTCEAFGVERLCLVDCAGQVQGRLFRAAGRVDVVRALALPEGPGVLGLEAGCGAPLSVVGWGGVTDLVLGGETHGHPRGWRSGCWAHIPQVGRVSGLTVEAALAIALYDRSLRRPAAPEAPR